MYDVFTSAPSLTLIGGPPLRSIAIVIVPLPRSLPGTAPLSVGQVVATSSKLTSTSAPAPVTSAGSLSLRSPPNFSMSARVTFSSAEALALNPLRSPSTRSSVNDALPSAPPAENVFVSLSAAAPAVLRHAVSPSFSRRSTRRLPSLRSSRLNAFGLMSAAEPSASATWPICSVGVFAGARRLERLTARQRGRPRLVRLSTGLRPRLATIGVVPGGHTAAAGLRFFLPAATSSAATAPPTMSATDKTAAAR